MIEPLRKPTKEDRRKREPIDKSMLAIPVEPPDHEPAWLAYIREFAVCLLIAGDCNGIIEAAHLDSRFYGTSQKGNDWAAGPLCSHHHRLYDGYLLDDRSYVLCWWRLMKLREVWHRMNRRRR